MHYVYNCNTFRQSRRDIDDVNKCLDGAAIFSLQTDPQQEDELWYNENHMSAPVDDFELELTEATREEILGGIQSIYARLLQKEIASNPGRQRRLNLAASRLFDRLILHHTEEECIQVYQKTWISRKTTHLF